MQTLTLYGYLLFLPFRLCLKAIVRKRRLVLVWMDAMKCTEWQDIEERLQPDYFDFGSIKEIS